MEFNNIMGELYGHGAVMHEMIGQSDTPRFMYYGNMTGNITKFTLRPGADGGIDYLATFISFQEASHELCELVKGMDDNIEWIRIPFNEEWEVISKWVVEDSDTNWPVPMKVS